MSENGVNRKALLFSGALIAATLAGMARRVVESHILYARASAWNTGFVAGQVYVEQNADASIEYKFTEPDNPYSEEWRP